MSMPIEFDDSMFFDRLQDMQLDEQEELLRRRINELKDAKQYADQHSRQFKALKAAQNKCESELHRVAQIQNRGRWSDAVRTVFGQEGFELVAMEIERMRGFPYRGAA